MVIQHPLAKGQNRNICKTSWAENTVIALQGHSFPSEPRAPGRAAGAKGRRCGAAVGGGVRGKGWGATRLSLARIWLVAGLGLSGA